MDGNLLMIRKTRHRLLIMIGKKPNLFYYIAWFKRNFRNLRVTSHTEIVIEGFPRSANSFAKVAFELAQNRPVRMAHHLHVPAQVIRGVQLRIPTIVLIREPIDAVASYAIQNPHISIHEALKEYIIFYTCIESHHKSYVVAPFEEVVSDFGRVIERVNKKFLTNFDPYVSSEENDKKCFSIIESVYDGEIPESRVCRPSEDRKQIKEGIMSEFGVGQNKALLEQAQRCYNRVVNL